MLGAGDAVATIKARLRAEKLDEVDVDQFVNQLTDIGFIYTEDQRKNSRNGCRIRQSLQAEHSMSTPAWRRQYSLHRC